MAHDFLAQDSKIQLFSTSDKGKANFKALIYDYYEEHKRSFSWRETHNPYHIVVSEIMLQQTQTDRVIGKFEQFIAEFPSIEILAQTPLSAVISAWQGLGYNRRALALHGFAKRVMDEFVGVIPDEPSVLETFRGIGPATASSICAFAFNKPTVFIETNIRAVFIHCFFKRGAIVHDADIMPLVAQTVDRDNTREWYYALMDFGVMLKKNYKNPSRKSAHYTVQTKFEGSDRQVRGRILRMLVDVALINEEELFASIPREREKIRGILQDLEKEGFISQREGNYFLVQD